MAQKKQQKQPTKQPKRQDKPVHVYGLWVYKTTKSTIHACACGGKYLKTRPRQTTCIKCMVNKRRQ